MTQCKSFFNFRCSHSVSFRSFSLKFLLNEATNIHGNENWILKKWKWARSWRFLSVVDLYTWQNEGFFFSSTFLNTFYDSYSYNMYLEDLFRTGLLWTILKSLFAAHPDVVEFEKGKVCRSGKICSLSVYRSRVEQTIDSLSIIFIIYHIEKNRS